MKNNEDIGSALKSKLEGLKNTPDDFVWSAIEGKLKKKKRRLLILYFSFGLGLLLLSLFIYNTFDKNKINDSNHQKQNIKIVEQENQSNQSKDGFFEDENPNKRSNKSLNTKNKISNDSTRINLNSKVTNKASVPIIQNTKKSTRSKKKSKTQNLSNSVVIKEENNKPSQSEDLDTHEMKNSNSSDENNFKLSQATSQIENSANIMTNKNKTALDSIPINENGVVANSEEDNIEETIVEMKKEEDSLPKKEFRWSINPQIIQSNYGAFNTKASDNSSINYGLLLGIEMIDNTTLRFGVRKLELKQTVNEVTNTVDYFEIPLEVKYAFRNKKLNPYITGGLSYFIFKDSNSENSRVLDYSNTVSLNFGLGLEYKLFNRLYIDLESNFNYQIEPITTNIDYTPYIFSITTGIDYRF